MKPGTGTSARGMGSERRGLRAEPRGASACQEWREGQCMKISAKEKPEIQEELLSMRGNRFQAVDGSPCVS